MHHKHKPSQAIEEGWKIQSYLGHWNYLALWYMLLNIGMDKFLLCKICKKLYLQHCFKTFFENIILTTLAWKISAIFVEENVMNITKSTKFTWENFK